MRVSPPHHKNQTVRPAARSHHPVTFTWEPDLRFSDAGLANSVTYLSVTPTSVSLRAVAAPGTLMPSHRGCRSPWRRARSRSTSACVGSLRVARAVRLSCRVPRLAMALRQPGRHAQAGSKKGSPQGVLGLERSGGAAADFRRLYSSGSRQRQSRGTPAKAEDGLRRQPLPRWRAWDR